MKEPLHGTFFHTVHDVLQATNCSLGNIQRLGSANSFYIAGNNNNNAVMNKCLQNRAAMILKEEELVESYADHCL